MPLYGQDYKTNWRQSTTDGYTTNMSPAVNDEPKTLQAAPSAFMGVESWLRLTSTSGILHSRTNVTCQSYTHGNINRLGDRNILDKKSIVNSLVFDQTFQ